jgi:hypothetical protein
MADEVTAVTAVDADEGDDETGKDKMYTVKKVIDWSYISSKNRIFYKVVLGSFLTAARTLPAKLGTTPAGG